MRYAQGDTPFDVLQCLLTNSTSYSYLEKLVGDSQLPAAILVSHFESRSPKDIQNWLQALKRWAEACRNSGAKNSLLLLLPLSMVTSEQLPPVDVRLKHSIWLGATSVLETRLLCRLVSEEVDAEAQWREYMLASLAGNDLGLAEYLWDTVLSDGLEIRNSLVSYADQRGWKINDIQPILHDWRPVPPGRSLHSLPNGRGFRLLQRGWTVSTPEFGEELHSAVLAILDRPAEIDHRIWRAQAALLLPMVDDIRRRICDSLSVRFGPGWAVIDNEPLESPIEMGKLKRYFENLSPQSWEKKQWGVGVNRAWEVRNYLAHYNPIPYAMFLSIWNLNASIHKMIRPL